MNDIPVSDAPTTTILVLFYILSVLRFFFVIIDNEKGAYYWSKGSRYKSIPPLLTSCLYLSSFSKTKFHFFFKKCGNTLILNGVNSLNISGSNVLLCTSKYKQVLLVNLMISFSTNRTFLIKSGLINECTTFPCLSLGC